MPKFLMAETIHSEKVITARLGAGTDAQAIVATARLNDKDVGKAVKLVAESRYALCADGDFIEGFLTSVNVATADGFAIGGVIASGYKDVYFAGAVTLGAYVVASAQAAVQTAQGTLAQVKPHATQATAQAAPFKWRVVSLGSAGTGAVGTTGLVERV